MKSVSSVPFVSSLPPYLTEGFEDRVAVLVGSVEEVGAPEHGTVLVALEVVGLTRAPEWHSVVSVVTVEPAVETHGVPVAGTHPRPVRKGSIDLCGTTNSLTEGK